MSTPVVMPQMGESIAEGTIVRWIKKIGDAVDRDEPLFEISTDKVDAEIPSPASGVLTDIAVHEGETVAVNTVVATIAEPGSAEAAAPAQGSAGVAAASRTAAASTQSQGDGQPASAGAAAPAAAKQAPSGPPAAPPSARPPRSPRAEEASKHVGAKTSASGNADRGGAARAAQAEPHPASGAEAAVPTPEELRRQKSSPLVRRIAREHDVDITQLHGSGIGGRVTKHDILEYLDHETDRDAGGGARGPDGARPPEQPGAARPEPRAPIAGANVEIKPLSVMRKKIAEHMIMSRRTSAHVHTVFHVNFSTVDRIRQQRKAEFEKVGARLTYMSFITKAVVDALRHHPMVNASLDGDNVVYHRDINIGVAVALETGLIVPVIKHADEKNLLGLTRAIADLAERARTKQLKPEDVQGGTFTITNPGQFGAQFGLPIINQPQSAILGVGTIEKRPVVIDDAIGIRTMAYLALGFDHRLIDGATADHFMADIKQRIEQFDPEEA